MTEDAEGRFKRAMDRLFLSPATSPSSNTEQDKKDSSSRNKAISMASKQAKGPSLSTQNRLSETNLSPYPHHVCRPWDRNDLFRRLATFKSMSWFGKPEFAGPVNCARHGWINVDVDLISCEGCNAMLSFPCPPAWSQHEAESAAAAFAEKLETGHKALCPWKENACSESLAQFPPTPIEALVEGFNDRCDALNQLSSLPIISSSAMDGMKKLKALQMEHFMAQATSDMVLANGAATDSSQQLAAMCTYHQAQRIISLCGWELQLLPYVIDYEGENTEFVKESPRSGRSVEAGPKVLLYPSEGERNASRRCDVGSAVLNCSLCGASVGLWSFSVVLRPSSLIKTEPSTVDSAHTAGRVSAASGIHKENCNNRNGVTDKIEKSGNAATSSLSNIVSTAASVLNLKLTIAGGPRPTQIHSLKSQLSPADKSNEQMKASQDEPIGHAVEEGNRHDRKRKWHEGSSLDERDTMEHKVRVLPCQSSVDAVDTCFHNRPENSAESVEMPPRSQQKASFSGDNTDSTRGVGMLTSDTVFAGALERTSLPLSKIMPYDRPVKAAVEASPLPEKPSDFRVLVDESSRVFDPILQHRHFCPWANPNIRTGACGWQLTLDALEALPAVEQSESASSIHSADPLFCVRKIFGG